MKLKDFFSYLLSNSKICHSNILCLRAVTWCGQCVLAGTGTLLCCYPISVELALFKVHAAALTSAKISTLNLFGKGVEKPRGFIRQEELGEMCGCLCLEK